MITSQTVDKVLAYFESEMTPLNGTKIVVTAWTDPEFAKRVVEETPAAIAGLDLPEGMAHAGGLHELMTSVNRDRDEPRTVNLMTSLPATPHVAGSQGYLVMSQQKHLYQRLLG